MKNITDKQNIQDAAEQVKKVCTKKVMKRIAAVLVVVAIAAGGGAAWKHHQKDVEKTQAVAAQTRIVALEAEKKGLVLLDEGKIRSLTAQALGLDENNVTYGKIALRDSVGGAKKDTDKEEKHAKHEGKKKGGEQRRDEQTLRQNPVTGDTQPVTAAPQAVPAAPAAAVNSKPSFRPIYDISCKSDSVKYKIQIDAVTGEVLHIDVA